MKTITIEMIRSWSPCYDPTDVEGVDEDWTGTVFDVLKSSIPSDDKLWIVLRIELIDEKILRQFARWRALSVIDLCQAPQIVIKYLNGDEEKRDEFDKWLDAAMDAARESRWWDAQVDKLIEIIEAAEAPGARLDNA